MSFLVTERQEPSSCKPQPKTFFQRIKKWAILSLIIFISVKTIQWWEGRGEGFRLYKIQDEVPYDSRWDLVTTPQEVEEAKRIIQQKFYYLGHGFQCYAFESEDGMYVIKFFRYQRLRLPNIIMSMPEFPLFSEWRKTRLLSLGRRKEYLLRSFKTSWQHAKDETALIYMQLNKKPQAGFPGVTIVDALGNEYLIYPDNYQFMLQKKALHIKPTIDALLAKTDIAGARDRIDQIFNLLLHCAKRGIQDTDGALIRKNNLGFLGDRAIYIDGGKLIFKDRLRSVKSFEKDLERLNPLLGWIKKTHPELETHFHASLKRVVQEYKEFLETRKAV